MSLPSQRLCTGELAGRPMRFLAAKRNGSVLAVLALLAALLVLTFPANRAFCGYGGNVCPDSGSRHLTSLKAALSTSQKMQMDRLEVEAIEEERKMKRERLKLETERKKEIEDNLPDSPVFYQWPLLHQRLSRMPSSNPGHLIQRRWASKGKDQGYVSLPFSAAVKSVLPKPGVNLVLVGRRDYSDALAKAWQKVSADLPLFDISGVADAPYDFDPMEPPWSTPLDELPTDDEMREITEQPYVLEHMSTRFRRPEEELQRRIRFHPEQEARILRTIVAGLPAEMLTEDFRRMVRTTSYHLLQTLGVVQISTKATKLRWRFACTDGDPDDELGSRSSDIKMRAYFVFSGEGVDFVPSKFVQMDRAKATSMLDSEQLTRMSSEDWATSVAAKNIKSEEILKRVPAGWTTLLKGDKWSNTEGSGATFRLKQQGKRVFLQVDLVESKRSRKPSVVGTEEEGDAGGEEEEQEEEVPSNLIWLGPLAGAAAGLYSLLRKTPPFTVGAQSRQNVNEVLRALQRQGTPMRSGAAAIAAREIEQRLWMDFADAEEAPVVLVVGGQTETGKVICRKLITSGYHVVLLKPGTEGEENPRLEKLLPQGAVLASAKVACHDMLLHVCNREIPDDLYSAVSGIDKLVVCNCDKESQSRWHGALVRNVLSCWQMYRYDFADRQRSYSSKVRLFNFERDTDFGLWGLEQQKQTDVNYGNQCAGWTRGVRNEAIFIGNFFDDIAQTLLKSPILKLNFKRFSGLILNCFNLDCVNTYSMVLRMGDFEETRVHYEFEFELEAHKFQTVRMPFNAFKPVRCDGVALPEGEEKVPLRREEVVQMGIVVRSGGTLRPNANGHGPGFHGLIIRTIQAFRRQAEPQVVYLGRDEDFGAEEFADDEEAEEEEVQDLNFSADDMLSDADELLWKKAEEEAAAEIDELMDEPVARKPEPTPEEDNEDFEEEGRGATERCCKPAVECVLHSGMAYTVIHINGLNDHPGGRFPVSVYEVPVTEAPLSRSFNNIGTISRGDAAELVVSAISEPQCVNSEMAAGESPRGSGAAEKGTPKASFEINSTTQENVKAYMKQVTPNA